MVYYWFGFVANEVAIQTGKELLRRHFIHHVSHDHDFENSNLFYRFLGDNKTKALNGKLTHQCAIRPGVFTCLHVGMFVIALCSNSANEVAEDLRRHILSLYDEHLSPNGLVSHAHKPVLQYDWTLFL